MSIIKNRLATGIYTENPVFIQVLSMCPLLATSTSLKNSIGMGVATTFVLIASNVVISTSRKLIPDKIRIPAYITIIAAFVTIVGFLLKGYVPELDKSLGLFIPLIVVNCIILGRAESYASKNSVYASFWDAVGMGLGFIVALVLVGFIRELIGSGTIFGITLIESYQPALIFVLAPGAFFVLGFLLAGINMIDANKRKKILENKKPIREVK